jgi:hypothetical protein
MVNQMRRPTNMGFGSNMGNQGLGMGGMNQQRPGGNFGQGNMGMGGPNFFG